MPRLIHFAGLLLFSVLAASVSAEDTGRPLEPTGHYLREWLLCGPFPALTDAEQDIEAIRLPGMYADFLQVIGGEANARPVVGQVISFAGEIGRAHV